MSKMGQELERRLDENKYELYEALELTRNNLRTLSDAALHYKKTFSANLEVLNQALAKIGGI